MAYYEIPDTPEYDDKIEKLTPNTRGHADVWNVIYQRIIENIAYIHNAVNVLKGSGDGSVTKLIAEEVAKIIADAPEDFDTLKEISDWIAGHQDSAAAMNAEINALKNNKLDKDGNAKTATKANQILAMRSDADLNTDLNSEEVMWIREQKPESPNSPSEHLYHVINIKGKGECRTQLALGITTDAVYYRNKNSLNAWEEWKELTFIKNGIFNTNYFRLGNPDNLPFGVELSYNGEGGNISWYAPDGTRWEFDCASNVFRLFNYSTLQMFEIDKNGNVTVNGDIKANGTKRVRAGDKVRMWSDNEGGNIDIESNTGKTSAQIDNLNDVLRIYIHDNVNNTNYFPITIGGSLVAVLTELKAAKGLNLLGMFKFYKDTNDSAYMEFGGVNSANNAQPHFRFRQWSNTLNVGPSTNGECSIGWDSSNMFANVAARNIYNSSGLITSSDKNKKKDLKNITLEFAEQLIDRLKPISFKYKEGTSGRRHYGLIAQDVEELLAELGIDNMDFAPLIKAYPKKEIENEDGSKNLETDREGEPEYYLRYEGFTGLIIKYIQGLKKKDLTLENKMTQLEGKLELLESKMTQLEGRLELLESKLNSI